MTEMTAPRDADADADAAPVEHDRDASFLEAARRAAAASLKKQNARAHARRERAAAKRAVIANSGIINSPVTTLGPIDESHAVHGAGGSTGVIAAAAPNGVVRKVTRARLDTARVRTTDASRGQNETPGDATPTLVRGREGASAIVDGADPIGVTALLVESALGHEGAFETVFCGYADGSVRSFHRPTDSSSEEIRSSSSSREPRSGWTETRRVHAPEGWNDAAGSVRIIKRVGSGRDDAGRLFVAYDNGSWTRFVFRKGEWSLLETPVLGPHPDFANAFRLKPQMRGNKWCGKKARCGAMCHVSLNDGTDGVLYLSSPVHGEHCVYRWEIPKAVCDSIPVSPPTPEPLSPCKTPQDLKNKSGTTTDSHEESSWEKFKRDVWGVVTKMDKHSDTVTSIAPFPALGSDSIISGGDDACVCVWTNTDMTPEPTHIGDSHSSKMYPACVAKAPAAVRAVAVSPDASTVFTAGGDRNVHAWTVARGHRKECGADVKLVYTRSFAGGHEGFVTALATLGGGNRCDFLLSGSEGGIKGDMWTPGDGGVKVWRVSDGYCTQSADTMRCDGTCTALVVRTDGAGRAIGVLRGGTDGAVVEWAVEWGLGGGRGDFPRGFLSK